MVNENGIQTDVPGKKKNKRNNNKRKFKNRLHSSKDPEHQESSKKQNSLEQEQHQQQHQQQHRQRDLYTPITQATSSLQQQKQQQNEDVLSYDERTFSGVVTPPPLPDNLQDPSHYKSPRKEAITRYKQGHADNANRLSELKENLKSNYFTARRIETPEVENNNMSNLPLSLDDKVNLFKCKSLEILEITNQNNFGGSLLAHGVFEVFQLHRGDVIFLSCGSTFVYPLLPKTKVLRINLNQFMLPLSKPERYWKIFLHTDDLGVVDTLVDVFQKNVHFVSLYEQDERSESHNIDIVPKELQSPENNYILNDIPDSPPSPPLSPRAYTQSRLDIPSQHQLQLLLSQPHITQNGEPIETLHSNIANLDINPKLLLHQPKPKRLSRYYSSSHQINNYGATKYSTIDEQSESSMDSLLDEYDQHLNKSTALTLRPPDRQPSIASTQYYQAMTGRNDGGLIQYYTMENKVHSYLRSRRSSRSELYTSESGWMEPNLTNQNNNDSSGNNIHHNINTTTSNHVNNHDVRTIPKTRSTYSINSAATDLHNIYRNIQLRNSQNSKIEEDTRSIKSMSRLPLASNSSISRVQLNRRRQSTYISSLTNDTNRKNDVKLDSREIYRMLSSKPEKPVLREPTTTASKRTSVASRLFGW